MPAPEVTVVRPAPHEWRALAGGQDCGTARAIVRPDCRCFVWLDGWTAAGCGPLLAAVARDVGQDLFVTVDEADRERLDCLRGLGFAVSRREHGYLIGVDQALASLRHASLPAGLRLASAADVDVDALRELDDELRADVPGADGWVNDPREFGAYTFDPGHFDRRTYLVAVDAASGRQAGLARVWNDPERRMLGLIAVVRAYRRRGVASALLAAAFEPLRADGIDAVAADVDVTNVASMNLMRRLGARRAGGTAELRRAAPGRIAESDSRAGTGQVREG